MTGGRYSLPPKYIILVFPRNSSIVKVFTETSGQRDGIQFPGKVLLRRESMKKYSVAVLVLMVFALVEQQYDAQNEK
jgi:hypothetical protein